MHFVLVGFLTQVELWISHDHQHLPSEHLQCCIKYELAHQIDVATKQLFKQAYAAPESSHAHFIPDFDYDHLQNSGWPVVGLDCLDIQRKYM